MPYIIGFVSQKGGSGKSTLARLLARELASNDYDTKIADLDSQQLTCTRWAAERGEREPVIGVQNFATLKLALKDAERHDALIIDGKANASTQTLDIAKAADLIIIPSKTTKDDMWPNVLLANSLADAGVDPARIAFVFTQTTGSDADLGAAQAYMGSVEYDVLEGNIEVKTTYGKANDNGLALSEVSHAGLRDKASVVAQSIINKLAAVGEKV